MDARIDNQHSGPIIRIYCLNKFKIDAVIVKRVTDHNDESRTLCHLMKMRVKGRVRLPLAPGVKHAARVIEMLPRFLAEPCLLPMARINHLELVWRKTIIFKLHFRLKTAHRLHGTAGEPICRTMKLEQRDVEFASCRFRLRETIGVPLPPQKFEAVDELISIHFFDCEAFRKSSRNST